MADQQQRNRPAGPSFGARLRRYCTATLAVFLGAGCSPTPRNWVACYHAEVPPESLRGFDLIVVDGAYRGDVARLKRDGAVVLAYISLGEVASSRPHFDRAKAAGLLVAENANWPGAWMVDVRKPAWHAMLVDEVAKGLLARGFDGLFLDTVDSSLNLEKSRPKEFAGMGAGVVALVARLRARHPAMALMLNGALPLVGPLRDHVTMVAMESSFTTWDFATRRARLRTPDELAWVRNVVAKARDANPDLKLFSLDYWDPGDAQGLRSIYRHQRAQGMIPYVATIALDRVVREPAAGESPP